MKKSEIKIGMKVVPFRKSAGFYRLKNSVEWKKAQELNQPFLYVTEKNEGCWNLSHENVPGTDHADFFHSWDFVPYVPSQVDTVSKPNEELNWCLTHECYTEFPIGFDGQCLIVSCRPVKLEKNWIDTVSEPSPAELAMMDANAESLRQDFEG